MGIIVVGFLLIGAVVLVLFGEALNKIAEEPAEYRTAPSVPEENGTVRKSPARAEIPGHL